LIGITKNRERQEQEKNRAKNTGLCRAGLKEWSGIGGKELADLSCLGLAPTNLSWELD
jgi:hypothetical protein